MSVRGKYGLGLIGKSPPDYRDFFLAAPSAILLALPEWAELRVLKATPKIFDQGQLGSCTANATNALVQYVERKHNDPDWDRLSRLWTYYYSRQKLGTTNSDSGALLRDAVAVSAEKGIPREIYWPYDVSKYALEPTAGVRSAPQHRTLEYRRIPDGSEQGMQACLAEGYPFVFGFAVYRSFWEVGDDGRWMGTRGVIDGYHAVAAWGYDFRPGAYGFHNGGWMVRNSWSEEWGDRGYFYVPRAFLPLEAFDCWTIRNVTR